MDCVGADEVLYRSVAWQHCQASPSDKVTSGAFLDPKFRPSVDRKDLCPGCPLDTQRSPEHGVVSLITMDVRKIKGVRRSAPDIEFAVDVEPVPIKGQPEQKDNPAHAEIFLHPDNYNEGAFRKLRISLARLANARPWAIKPPRLP